MRRSLVMLRGIVLAGLLLTPSSLFAQQSVNFYIGAFVPRSEDARVSGDVLVDNLDFFIFKISEFKSFTGGGEWLVALGRHAEAGIGIGIYSDTVHSRYRDFVSDAGEEIRQDLKLRIAPITATVRFLPLSAKAAVQPYIGGGVGIFAWRYAETGQFIDFNSDIFRDSFVDSGATVGPVVVGGVRVPVGGWAVGGEIRYQAASGDLDTNKFLSPKIDLGGFSYLATFNIRF